LAFLQCTYSTLDSAYIPEPGEEITVVGKTWHQQAIERLYGHEQQKTLGFEKRTVPRVQICHKPFLIHAVAAV